MGIKGNHVDTLWIYLSNLESQQCVATHQEIMVQGWDGKVILQAEDKM